ncbi:methylamine utilization protein [Salinisphaera aquimarina]|uniref:methylamine utilization protein n=1 Tax=Salinisphaera aquimarina TaxID=2094031 RepID=UPI0036D2E555
MKTRSLTRACKRTASVLLCSASLLLTATPAGAVDVDVTITGPDGQPLEYAAVMARWPGATKPQANLIPAVMDQRNLTFVPHMLVVPQGSQVVFPNQDKTRHHVYSFSKTKTFDIKLYIGRPQRPITFDTPGVVTVGCNIHDQMQAFIVVSDDPRWAITDANGHARLAALPDSTVTLSIWHPWMISEDARVTRVLEPGTRQARITLDVDPPPTPPASSGSSLQDRFNELSH